MNSPKYTTFILLISQDKTTWVKMINHVKHPQQFQANRSCKQTQLKKLLKFGGFNLKHSKHLAYRHNISYRQVEDRRQKGDTCPFGFLSDYWPGLGLV